MAPLENKRLDKVDLVQYHQLFPKRNLSEAYQ
jgi:hypothetical protein